MCDIEDQKNDGKDIILLLEFLVETLEIDHHIINSQPELKPGTTTVQFSFLDLPPLEFKEETLPIGRNKETADLKSGKSCLFSLPNFPNIPEDNLEVTIHIIRELPPSIIPNKIPIAKTIIDLSSIYQTLVKETRAHPYCLPITKAHKECYLLTNLTGTRIAGSICVYMRASCFGKIIVSQFRMSPQECIFQGSSQGIHPLMYQLAGIPKRPPDAKDIFPYDRVPPKLAESIIDEILAGIPPGGCTDNIAQCQKQSYSDKCQQHSFLLQSPQKPSKYFEKGDPNPSNGYPSDAAQGPSKYPNSFGDVAGQLTSTSPYAQREQDCQCAGTKGPIINMKEDGPGESFFVQRDYCMGGSGGVCVCGQLTKVVGPGARKVKGLEAEMRGHTLAVRVPKSSDETNWYELELNRLFNENTPCVCGDSRDPKRSKHNFRSAESEASLRQRNKKCIGICADSTAVSDSPSAQTFVSNQYATTTATTAAKEPPRADAVSKATAKIEPPKFTSIREYTGKTDIQVKTPYDPDHDVFVLKVTKKGQQPEVKPQLELELRTPKRPIPSPVTRLTRETQYESNDVKGGGGGGGKSKGGKGKKGKKGKKKK